MAAERRIFFETAHLSYLNVFNFEPKKRQSQESAQKILQENNIILSVNDEIVADFKTAQDFLFASHIHRNILRFNILGFSIKFPACCTSSVNDELEVSAILSIYNELKLASLLFSINLTNTDVDTIIYISQLFSGRQDRYPANLPGYIFCKDYLFDIHGIIKNYICVLKNVFRCINNDDHLSFSRCLELHDIVDDKIGRPGEIVRNCPRQFYGLLTNDEAWEFVPDKVAEEKTGKFWRTRNFLNVLAFDRCVLLVNFYRSKRFIEYERAQKHINRKFGQLPNKYFQFFPKIGGLNHGPLLLLELSTIQHCFLDRLVYRVGKRPRKNIRKHLNDRKELLQAINKIKLIKIKEISILGKQIEESMALTDRLADLSTMLEETERALMIKYTQRINFLVIILTALATMLAFANFICAKPILSIVKPYYEQVIGKERKGETQHVTGVTTGIGDSNNEDITNSPTNKVKP